MPAAATPNAPGRLTWHRSATLLVIASFVTVLGFGTVCGSILYDMRRGQEQLARQASENLAATIDADISRNIEVLDLSLRAVTANLLSPELDKVSREVRNLILFDHAATARHFGALQVFDASGKLTIDASTFDPPPISVAEEEFFTAHRDNPGIGLFISRPMIYRGAYTIVLSRRISTPEGQFRGVVAGALRFSYFQELFGRLKLGPDDVISALRRDGTVIMRLPFDLNVMGSDLSHLPAVRAAINAPDGSASGMGNSKHMFAWRGTAGSLIVMVAKPWDAIYDVWREQAIRIGLIMTVLAAAAAVMTMFLAREIQRRSDAEEALETLATTDALTGLRNRRKFDAQIELEWRRCARAFAPLSLMMIDVDHFKAYNDRFGHQAGDKALAAIAACIAMAAKRPGDCAARYGGEEFALLLPGIGASDALDIAEAIRLRVTRWREAPLPSSVSIGVATLTPDGQSTPAVLVELADRALYEAKRTGRNRVSAASATPSAMVA